MGITIRRFAVATLCVAPLALITACGGGGGGGGGGGSASLTGRVLLVSTAQPPDPAATVTVAGRPTTTLSDGTFTLTGLPSSATSVTISATGEQTLTQPLPALASGGVTDLGEVYLSADGYTANVTGRVVSADTQKPIAGASVTISGQRTTSASDGTFALSGLPVSLGLGGAQIGVVTASGYDDKALVLDLELDTGANDLGDILMSAHVGTIPGGPQTIAGTVTLQGQSNASGVTVALIDAGGNEIADAVTTSAGSYGFWVGKGDYTLSFRPPTGFQPKNVAVSVTDITMVQTVNVTLTP